MMTLLLVVATEGGVGISSDTLIAFVLGGSILTTLVGAYRFVVNMRTTERGIARDRVVRANEDVVAARRGRVRAQAEADAWQAYAGDLIFALRTNGIPAPPMPRELKALMNATPQPAPREDFDSGLRALHVDVAEIAANNLGDDEGQSP